MLLPTSALTDLDRAGLRHSAVPSSCLIFSLYRLPPAVVLTTEEVTFLYFHRLRIHLTFIPHPPLPHCLCRRYYPPKAFPPALLVTAALACHAVSCPKLRMLHKRHDDAVRLVGTVAEHELGVEAELKHRLSSSATAGTKVDLVLTSYRLSPAVVTLDLTISCPLLPAHLTAAIASAAALFDKREREKNDKHLAGELDQGRAFLALVLSTLGGIGPPDVLDYLDSIFQEALARELASTGNAANTTSRRILFFQSLHACIARASARMAFRLTRPDAGFAPPAPVPLAAVPPLADGSPALPPSAAASAPRPASPASSASSRTCANSDDEDAS